MYLDVIGLSKEFFISWAFHVNFLFVVRTKANLKELKCVIFSNIPVHIAQKQSFSFSFLLGN